MPMLLVWALMRGKDGADSDCRYQCRWLSVTSWRRKRFGLGFPHDDEGGGTWIGMETIRNPTGL